MSCCGMIFAIAATFCFARRKFNRAQNCFRLQCVVHHGDKFAVPAAEMEISVPTGWN